MVSGTKPLGHKAYGSIGHLPTSRLGPGDHAVHAGQARICLEKARDKRDHIWVQEKVDGSCCSVAKIDGQILALGRAGYLASSSPFEQQHRFAVWVDAHASWFGSFLSDGERVVGEWLAQAHGTRYDSTHVDFSPFVPFDVMVGHERLPLVLLTERLAQHDTSPPHLLGFGPLSVAQVQAAITVSHHGAIDAVEGAVWRVEREGKVDFLAKWVRPDKVDGIYLPEVSGLAPVWNWEAQ